MRARFIVQTLLMNESYTLFSREPCSEIESNTHEKDDEARKSIAKLPEISCKPQHV